jgi:hypothetical protein
LSSVIVHSGDYYTEEEASFMTALKIQEELDKQQQIESDHALALSLQRRGSDEGESEEGEESDQEELCRGTDDADPGSSALSSPGRSDLTEPPDGSISPAPSSPALSDLTEMSDTDLSALEKRAISPTRTTQGNGRPLYLQRARARRRCIQLHQRLQCSRHLASRVSHQSPRL